MSPRRRWPRSLIRVPRPEDGQTRECPGLAERRRAWFSQPLPELEPVCPLAGAPTMGCHWDLRLSHGRDCAASCRGTGSDRETLNGGTIMRRRIVGACVAVLAAGISAVGAPGALAAAGGPIHPGVQTFTAGAQCTANFIFKDASSTYIGQAAHCSGTGAATRRTRHSRRARARRQRRTVATPRRCRSAPRSP